MSRLVWLYDSRLSRGLFQAAYRLRIRTFVEEKADTPDILGRTNQHLSIIFAIEEKSIGTIDR